MENMLIPALLIVRHVNINFFTNRSFCITRIKLIEIILKAKGQLSYEQWPWQKLPPFLAGSSYLISGSVIHSLLVAAQVTPYLHAEDVYITGILTEIAKVTIRSSTFDRFSSSL